MDITPYVDRLRGDLMSAAASSGDELRSAAERLGFALDPAARLALMEAVSQAASEITAELPSGSVDVRLDGRDLAFVVTGGPEPAMPGATPAPPAPPVPPTPPGSDGAARVTLRLPESVKARAEEAAGDAGQSLNTWLVNVVRAATEASGQFNVNVDLSGVPFLGKQGSSRKSGARRMTGWV